MQTLEDPHFKEGSGHPDEPYDHYAPRSYNVQVVAWFLAAIPIAIGFITWVEYAASVHILDQIVPGSTRMSPLTALALIITALAPLLYPRRRLCGALVALALTIALCALFSHLLVGEDRISPALANVMLASSHVPIGRMSPATATCLLLLSLAPGARLCQRPKPCDMLATAAFSLAGIGLLGYVYGVRDLYTVPIFSLMAFHTALALLCLSVSIMLHQVDKGWFRIITLSNRAGSTTRRQLALTAVLPIIGWLLLWAVNSGAVSASAALTLVVATVFLPLTVLIIKDGRANDRLDRQRYKQQKLEGTIRRRLELELAEKRAALEHEAAQRLAVEQAMNQAKRLEAIGQLTGGIAHDFNNLLMGISGNLELLERQAGEDQKTLKYVRRAALATDKGIRLTSQLLAFSRTQRLNLVAVTLKESIAAAFQLVSNALGPGITIDMPPPSESLRVQTDPLQLEMAILNLALNARDAMPEGGCFSVTCTAASPVTGGLVSIVVSDTGTGMSPDVLAKACEPFFTTKQQGRGTGLGLAQVYGLCGQCGGELCINSTLGKGTTFELRLPAADAPPVTALPRPTLTAQGVIARPILVVDDDDMVRTVVADDLRARGYDVLEASDGADALTKLETTGCAAAVIDFLMPGMNGAEVAKAARGLQPELSIVFISGYSDTLQLEAIHRAVLVRKPFELDILNATLHRLVFDGATADDARVC